MQSTLDTACVVSYNSKDCRRVLGGGQGSSWNTRPKPSLLADVSAAFERVCMCVCTHIYDCVCPCVVWGKGVEAKVVSKIHLCRSPGNPSRDKQCSQKEFIIKNGRGLLLTPRYTLSETRQLAHRGYAPPVVLYCIIYTSYYQTMSHMVPAAIPSCFKSGKPATSQPVNMSASEPVDQSTSQPVDQ